METTLVILKPDALARCLVGQITSRLEAKGLVLVGMRMDYLDDAILREHYDHLADKPFFPGIQAFMQRTPVVFQAWKGVDAVRVLRDVAGVTNGRDAEPGTIRGDFGMSIQANLLHASDSVDSAKQELERFFDPEQLFDYEHPLQGYFNSPDELT